MRLAARLGLSWGLGHATTLFVFGLPIVLYRAYLPQPVQEGAETAIGVVIVALAAWLLLRWHRGVFHRQGHAHGAPPKKARTPFQAYCIGLVTRNGRERRGRDPAALDDRGPRRRGRGPGAVRALHGGLEAAPVRGSFHRIAPALGVSSMAFGVWYALGALSLAPYYF